MIFSSVVLCFGLFSAALGQRFPPPRGLRQGIPPPLEEDYDYGDYSPNTDPIPPTQILNDKCVQGCVEEFTQVVIRETGTHPHHLPSVGLFLDENMIKGICAGRGYMLQCLNKCDYSLEREHKLTRLHRDFMRALCHPDVIQNFNFTCYNKAVEQMQFLCTTCEVKLIARSRLQTQHVCQQMQTCVECSIFNVEWFCGYETQLQARIIFGELAKDVYRMARDEEGPSVNLPHPPESCARLMIDSYLAKSELEMDGRGRRGWVRRKFKEVQQKKKPATTTRAPPPRRTNPPRPAKTQPPKPAATSKPNRATEAPARATRAPVKATTAAPKKGAPVTSEPLPEDCIDKDDRCPTWAGRGECSWNPKYMGVICQRSCDCCGCDTPKEAESRIKGRDNAASGAAGGSVERSRRGKPKLPEEAVADTLNRHGIATRIIPKTTKAPQASEEESEEEEKSKQISQEDAAASSSGESDEEEEPELTMPEGSKESSLDENCVDSDPVKCKEWKWRGECEKNPGWMKPHCQKSCECCGCTEDDFD